MPSSRQDMPGITAVHVVMYALLDELLQFGHDVIYQPVFNRFRASDALTPIEEESIRLLQTRGVSVLTAIPESLYLGRARGRGVFRHVARAWALLGGTRFSHFYPAVAAAPEISTVVGQHNPDAVLTLWSPEGIAATHHLEDMPRVAYQGDVDFVPGLTRQAEPELFFPTRRRSALAGLRDRLWYAEAYRAHLRLMRRVTVIANVTAANADYYRANGHPRSVYVRNTWPDPESKRLSAGPSAPAQRGPFKIIGHVGYLDRTGSTYGLRLLLTEVMPCLREELAGLDYEVHVIGGGEPVPVLRPLMTQDRLVVRGFVEDLEAEYDSADAMVLLNSASPDRCAYTRHLIAWSHGLCLIVHEYSRQAIPEIVHLENALVGGSAAEIARLIRLSLTDDATNWKVRSGGLSTYRQYFTPAAVARGVEAELKVAVNAVRNGSSAEALRPA